MTLAVAIGPDGLVFSVQERGGLSRIIAHTREREGMITGIHGTSATDVWFTGEGALHHFDGEVLAAISAPQSLTMNMFRSEGREWICGEHTLFMNGEAVASHDAEQLFGVAVGGEGVFILGDGVIYEARDGVFVSVADLRVEDARSSTAIVGDGARAVVGGVTTVFVNAGRGFEAWPA